MKTTDTIIEALSILRGHDFDYALVDYGYERAKERARASMRHYVEVTNTLPGELREMMRDLWTAAYEFAACCKPFWTAPDIEEKKTVYENIKNQVNALVAA